MPVAALLKCLTDIWGDSLESGYEQGRDSGYEAGFASGMATGYTAGYTEGKTQGLAEGTAEGTRQAYLVAGRDLGISRAVPDPLLSARGGSYLPPLRFFGSSGK